MTPETRADAIRDLVIVAIAWRIARSGSLDWQSAKERALMLYPADGVPWDIELYQIKHIAECAASEVVVGTPISCGDDVT